MDDRPPTLTERRKAATQLDIARAAARLFTEQGAQGTTTEAIAASAGVALRTFYRYFRSKEDAVAPLLTVGADAWRAHLAGTTHGAPLREAVAEAIRSTLTDAEQDDSFPYTRGLLRAAADDADLAGVWYRVNRESERQLLPVLARLAPGTDDLSLRLVAAAATDAIRIAFETWAVGDDDHAPVEIAVQCFHALSGPLRSD